MSAGHNNMKSPLLAVLAAALVFSVSSWSGQSETAVQSMSLSSQLRICDVEQKLSRSKEGIAECPFDDGDFKGQIHVRKDVETRYDHTKSDAPQVSEARWRVSVDCPECSGVDKKLFSDSFSDMRQAAAAAEQMAVRMVQAAKEKKAEVAAKAEREKKCEIDASGKELKEKTEVLTCKIDRLAGKSREEQAEYFESEIRPEVQAMLACDSLSSSSMLASMFLSNSSTISAGDTRCTAERNKANRLLSKLQTTAGSNFVIGSAVNDLTRFGLYSAAVQQLNISYAAIANFPPNDPRRREAVQQLSAQLMGLKSNWGMYFAQRGMAIQNNYSQLEWEGMTLQSGLNSSNNLFNSIADQHLQYLQAGTYNGWNNGFNNSFNNVNNNPQYGRTGVRGNLSTNYAGAPAPLNNGGRFNPGVANQAGVAGRPVTTTPAFNGAQGGLPFQANRAPIPPTGVQGQPNRPLGSGIVKPTFNSPVGGATGIRN